MNNIKLEEVVHFDVITHHPGQSGIRTAADEAPRFWVFEEDTDTAIIQSSGMTARGGHFVGMYRGQFAASALNGFENQKFYNVMVSGRVTNLVDFDIPMRFFVEDKSFTNMVTTSGVWASGIPVYYADLKFVKDDASGVDEYTAQWYRNDVPCSSGDITSPKIDVIMRSTGSHLIGVEIDMDFISTDIGTVKYDQSSQTFSAGETYIMKVQAVIDGQTRVWQRILGRDSV